MHKNSEKTWLAHLAEDRRYAAMAGLVFPRGSLFSSSIRRNRRGCRKRACKSRRSASSASLLSPTSLNLFGRPFSTNMIRRCSPHWLGADACYCFELPENSAPFVVGPPIARSRDRE